MNVFGVDMSTAYARKRRWCTLNARLQYSAIVARPGAIKAGDRETLMKIVRFILALAVGIVIFSLTVAAVEAIGHGFYPPPAEFQQIGDRMSDAMRAQDQAAFERTQAELAEAMAAYLPTAPTGSFIFVVAAWIAGAFVGGGVAAFVTSWGRRSVAMLVGVADVGAIILVSSLLPGPGWMPFVGIAGSLIAAFAAGTLVASGTRAKPSL